MKITLDGGQLIEIDQLNGKVTLLAEQIQLIEGAV